MSTETGPVFVERRTYRRRRFIDAARLLPVLGVVLVCIPLLWTGATATTYAMIYFFGLWLVLVMAAAAISRHLHSLETDERDDQTPAGDG